MFFFFAVQKIVAQFSTSPQVDGTFCWALFDLNADAAFIAGAGDDDDRSQRNLNNMTLIEGLLQFFQTKLLSQGFPIAPLVGETTKKMAASSGLFPVPKDVGTPPPSPEFYPEDELRKLHKLFPELDNFECSMPEVQNKAIVVTGCPLYFSTLRLLVNLSHHSPETAIAICSVSSIASSASVHASRNHFPLPRLDALAGLLAWCAVWRLQMSELSGSAINIPDAVPAAIPLGHDTLSPTELPLAVSLLI